MKGQSTATWKLAALAGLALALGLGALAPLVAADDACEGYAQDRRLRGLGGRNSFGPTVGTLEDLQREIDALEPDIRFVLDKHGLAHATDGLLAAIRSGEGISETEVVRGDQYGWIAFRRGGEPNGLDGVCMDLRMDQSYPAFVVEVKTEKEMGDAPEAMCGANIRRDCEGGMTVDAAGSSEGVKVMLGGETIIPSNGSATSWSGSDANPFTEDLEIMVSAETQGTKEVTTHTFVIPKICLNMAYAGATTATEPGAVKTCEKTIGVDACVAPEPSCAISLSASEVKAGDPLTVDVSGSWADGGLEMGVQDADGNALSEPAIGQPPATVTFDDPGIYTIVGTATNQVGDTATCSAAVEVKGGWTFRPFGAYLSQDEAVGPTAAAPRADGVVVREKLGISNGVAVGADLEYHYTDHLGVEIGFMYGQFDSTYTLDLDDQWGMDNDDLGMLALTLGPSFHLTPDSRADLYFTPFIGLVQLDDGSYSALGESKSTDFGSEFAWGAKLGVDIPFSDGSPWGLNLGARYLKFDVDSGLPGGGAIDVTPLGLSLGLAYDF